ncbi:hypothetical protein SAMN05660657_01435 [Geodermatophilus amargosae]|uniref:Acetyltransferase (GNAT) domain-containing protein n=1 Tax=Geodermatophilus amargosae TaxID=1296565 RepID=A0A1I6YT10_9ACTN|nr:hypothetical protein SAMN05660657_01435 [Geodermatophilus amargosae]
MTWTPGSVWRGLGHRWWIRTDEPALSRYYSAFRRSGRTSVAFAVRHPVATLLALVATARLPSVQARLSAGPGGAALYEALCRPVVLGAGLGVTGVSVLAVPADPQEYLQGRARQTLRRRFRSAERRGITCRPVDDPAERRALVRLADEAEKSHPDPRYRIDSPDNTDLLEHGLWLVACAPQGRPLLLSVTPTDGEWGLLRYFRTLGHGPEYSDSRYLMCVALVEALAGHGVRYLVDTWHPGGIPEGLRQFQRSVGYRLVRVIPRRTSRVNLPGESAVLARELPRAEA